MSRFAQRQKDFKIIYRMKEKPVEKKEGRTEWKWQEEEKFRQSSITGS
jgi:hypothetical protein